MGNRVNPHVADPCAACRGWGFYSVSKDPDIEAKCLDCQGTGNQNKEGDRVSTTITFPEEGGRTQEVDLDDPEFNQWLTFPGSHSARYAADYHANIDGVNYRLMRVQSSGSGESEQGDLLAFRESARADGGVR